MYQCIKYDIDLFCTFRGSLQIYLKVIYNAYSPKYIGHFIGNQGQQCDKVCSDRGLTCRWLEISQPNNYTEMLSSHNHTCTNNKTTVWKEEWEPVISTTGHCFGALNVTASRCEGADTMDTTYRRFCRCIYPGKIRFVVLP